MSDSRKKRERKSPLCPREDIDDDSRVQIIPRIGAVQFDIEIEACDDEIKACDDEIEVCDGETKATDDDTNSEDKDSPLSSIKVETINEIDLFEAEENEIDILEDSHNEEHEIEYLDDLNNDDEDISTLAAFFGNNKAPNSRSSRSSKNVIPLRSPEKEFDKQDGGDLDNIDDTEEHYINALAIALHSKNNAGNTQGQNKKDLEQLPDVRSRNVKDESKTVDTDNIDDTEEHYINALAIALHSKNNAGNTQGQNKKDLEQSPDVGSCNVKDESKTVNTKSCPAKRRSTRKTVNKIDKNLVLQLKLDERIVCDMLEDLSEQNTERVDQILAIEIKNMMWRVKFNMHQNTPLEEKIQKSLNNWKVTESWSKYQEPPLMYLCFVCQQAWWHLGPFRKHIKRHSKEVNYNIEPVFETYECCIIGYIRSKPQMTYFPIDSYCWKCGNNWQYHLNILNSKSKSYSCKGCDEKFGYCRRLALHEGNCKKFLMKYALNNDKSKMVLLKCPVCSFKTLRDSLLEHHLENFHDVRSDVPNTSGIKTCPLCHQCFTVYLHHHCPKRDLKYICTYCHKRYLNQHLLDIHLKNNEVDYKCRICNEPLQKKCMELKHMVEHSKLYGVMYKCLCCEDNIMFPDENSIKRHRYIWHRRKLYTKRDNYELVLVPKELTKPENLTKLDIRMEMKETNSKRPSSEELEILQDDSQEINEDQPSSSVKDSQNIQDNVRKATSQIDCSSEKQCFSEKSRKAIYKASNVKQEKISDEEINGQLDSTYLALALQKELGQETTVKEENIFKEEIVEEKHIAEAFIDHSKQMYEEAIVKKEISKEKSDKSNVCMNKRTIIKQEKLPGVEILEEENLDFAVPPTIGDQDSNFVEINEEIENMDIDVESNTKIDVDVEFDTNYDNEDSYAGVLTQILKKSSVTSIPVKKNLSNEAKASTSKTNSRKKKEKKMYDCGMCDAYGSRQWLKYHMSEHSDKAVTFCCSKCSTKFKTMKTYLVHLPQHGYTPKTCPECDRSYKTYGSLNQHIQARCKTLFIKKNVFKKTIYGMISHKRNQCRMCLQCVEAHQMFNHWESHLEISELVTKGITAGTLKVEPLSPKSRNEDTDPEEETEKDSQENKDDTDTEQLSPQMLKAVIAELVEASTKNSRRSCVVCQRPSFDRRHEYKRHMVEHLLKDAYLRKHEHNSLRCQICQKDFQQVTDYKLHMRFHGNLPVYECTMCRKHFSDSSNFTKHKKIHNVDVLVCDVCKSKFKSKQALIKHIEAHEKMAPITCECSQVFYKLSGYKKHQRTAHNTEEFKYPCIICRKRFKTLKDRWDHMWFTHKERKTKADCPLCGKAYRKLSDVKKHLRTHHGMDVTMASFLKDLKTVMKEAKRLNAEGTGKQEAVKTVIKTEAGKKITFMFDS